MKRILAISLAVGIFASISLGIHYVPPVKYGQEYVLYFGIYDSNSPWRLYETAPTSADDIHIIKDGGTAANPTNNVTDLGKSMSLTITATEMQAGQVVVEVNDASSTKLYMDDIWVIPTYGDASALGAFDLDDANPIVDVNKIDGRDVVAEATVTIAVSVGQTATAAANIEAVYVTNWATDWNDVTNMWSTDVNTVRGSTPFEATSDTVVISSSSVDAITDAIDANCTAVDSVLANAAQGGAAAVLTLDSIIVNNADGVGVTITGTTDGILATGTAGDGVHFTSTGSNGHGFDVTGNGSGEGISATGGASGHGLAATGGTAGAGIVATGTTNNSGLYVQGHGVAAGLQATGGVEGNGLSAIGGATSGNGFSGSATDGHGMRLSGGTAGEGLSAVGGNTGNGVQIDGGASSGSGLYINGNAGNGHGIYAAGQGSGSGLSTTGGATGNGIRASGGVTSGDGIYALALNNNDSGIQAVANGTGDDLDADSVASPTDINDAMVHGDATWGASGGFDPNTTPITLQAADKTKLGYLTGNVATASSLTAGVAQLDAAIGDVNTAVAAVGSGAPFSGTAQASTSNTLVLAAATAATVDFKGWIAVILTGTGAGQMGMIQSYDAATDTASMYESWAVTPGAGSTYALYPSAYDLLKKIMAKR